MAAIAQQAHRHRRGKVFYFRIAVPLALQDSLGKEYKCSLKTGDYRLSAYLCRHMSCKAEDFFMTVTRKIPTEDDLRKFMRSYFEQQLEQARFDYNSARSMFYGNEPDKPSKDPYGVIRAAQNALAKAKSQAATHEYTDEQENEAESLLNEANFETYPYSGKLAQYMMDALVEAKRIELAYHKKDFADIEIRHPLLIGTRNVFSPSYKAQITLGQCTKYFIEHKAGSVKAKTLKRLEIFMARMCDILGENKDMRSISKQPDGVLLERAILKFPANYTRDYQAKGESVMGLIESGKNYKKMGPRTIMSYWIHFNEFFAWAADREFIQKNPIANITPNVSIPKKTSRTPFSNEQLKTLFSSPIYTGRKNRGRKLWDTGHLILKDGQFWLPLIGLFMGMREAEILQLTPEDIKEEDGILYFDVNRNDGKDAKTDPSIRLVPVHPELIKMGFADYLTERKKVVKNKGRIFEDGITIPKNMEIIKNYSRNFSEYTVRIGMRSQKDGREVFHSFRHNLQTALGKAGVQNILSCQIVGHEKPEKEMTTGDLVYDHNNLSLRDKYEIISKAKYDVDLSHLYIKK
ncbi:MAG: site-specific integrase [Alphaproteobacteria bacterium]|nr:site-specific integrase [Alphaproteobacteria bacterium]